MVRLSMVRCAVGGPGVCQAPLLEAISAAFHPSADLGAQDKSPAESGLGFDVLFCFFLQNSLWEIGIVPDSLHIKGGEQMKTMNLKKICLSADWISRRYIILFHDMFGCVSGDDLGPLEAFNSTWICMFLANLRNPWEFLVEPFAI